VPARLERVTDPDVPAFARAFQRFLEVVNEIVIGAVDYVSLADGLSSTRMCVRAGLYLIRDGGNAAAVLLREPHDHTPRPAVGVEVLATGRDYAARIVADIRRLSLERSVFRNQVISFAASPFGEQSAGPLASHPRPQLAREDVILPEATFAAIEEHVFGIAAHR
jgi:hypothetical protein